MAAEELAEYKANENKRRSELCRKQKAKMTEEDYLHDSLRKVVKQNLSSPDLIRLPSPSYRSKQSYGKAMKLSIEALPSSPRKKAVVVRFS